MLLIYDTLNMYEKEGFAMFKYPRTYHFSFSEGATSDDKITENDFLLKDKKIMISEKMDGENTTIYNNYWHARSLTSAHQKYHSKFIKRIQEFQYLIPDNIRICGEDLCVKHSIFYDRLADIFLAFSVWEDEVCYSWKDTEEICEMLGLKTVPILYEGNFDIDVIKDIAKKTVKLGGEGIVVRNSDSFLYKDFSRNVMKFVRKNHVQTDKHWSQNEIIYNEVFA